MANEIFARIQLIWNYKLSERIIDVDESWRDESLDRYNKTLQNVGSGGWEALEIGDLAKTWMTIKNLDDTNFVAWGKSVGDATELIRIPPGKLVFFYLIAAAPAVKADTAACDIEIRGVEGTS